MGLIKFLLFLFIYIPFNVVVMLLAALCFSVLNKVLGLNFPILIVAFAAGVMVFVMFVSFIETSSMKNGNINLYYSATIAINIIVIIAMLTFSGIGRLVLKKKTGTVAFSFGNTQKIAALAYCVTVGSLAAIPAFANGKDWLQDMTNEKYKTHIKGIIETDNKKDFEAALEKNNNLAELRLDYTTQSLLECLLVQNKTVLVDILIKHNKTLLSYTINWDINSPEMIKVLIDNGMTAVSIVEKLTFKNKTGLVKMAVEKYRPKFDEGNLLTVQYIVRNMLDYNHNMELFNYLVAHGLATGSSQSNEAINYFIKKNDFKTVKMLDEKGFKIDTARHDMMETAISNDNTGIIDLLFEHGYNINRPFNEYTYVEHAIISNAETVIDGLLKLKPDVTTLHPTYDEPEINALMLAEKYKRTEILQKLKAYSDYK